jgi:hypothetical protein
VLVHADEHDAVLGALDDLDVGRLLEARHVLRRRIVDEVDLAGDERGEPRRVRADRREHDLVHVALEEPALIPHQLGFLASTVFTSGSRDFSMYGPVPFAWCAWPCPPCRVVLRLGGAVLLAPCLGHDVDGRDVVELDGLGPLVVNSTVRSSILRGMPAELE